MTKKQKKMLLRILVSAALMVGLLFVPATGWLRFALWLVPYLIIGWDILYDAVRGIINGQVFDENFLMAVATVGAMALGLSGSGDYTEAVAVMLFYQIGEWFQSYAVGKSRRSIGALMDIRPDFARVVRDGAAEEMDPEAVAVGSIIAVQPGERVPLDGVVVEGVSSLDTAALTGESLPRDVAAGDEVVSGCINMTGLLHLRATKPYGESTVARILDLVENAGSRKAGAEKLITRFARVYTPAVCAAALLLAVVPPVVSLLLGGAPGWGVWVYRALTFLVISCPCALVISIPLTFFAGIGGASRCGVLVKGSNYLEALAAVDCVVLDKTGTLTKGTFAVTEICPEGMEKEELLALTALAECASNHPISRSLTAAWGGSEAGHRVTDIREVSGHGVEATVDGRRIAAGNGRWMAAQGVTCPACDAVGTVVHTAVDGVYAGYIVISDEVKAGAAEAVAALRRAGVKKTVMLTGDNEGAARAVVEAVGVDEVHSRLLPEDKVTAVEALLQSGRGKLAFVGDGVNDAPVLSRADVGIAMGALGSDAAIEAADVVLMDDDPRKIALAIRIARQCLAIVRQNIVFALGVKALCLLLVALGFADMWLGIFADVGVMVLAVLNAMRALHAGKEA
ncbi:MAG: cadmium-translocating P-type ATPase [Oscillospiraceae bacterium]|nr:cadmium-translocating P-type ATPase [Oscillospiraceae bacterium]